MRRSPFLFGLLTAAFLLGGCTYPIIDYRRAVPAVPTGGSRPSLAVSGVDVREQLLSKDIPPNYVGSLRDGFGIPYHLNTVRQQPLINQLVIAVAKGYSDAGYSAQAVVNPNLTNRAAGLAALQKTRASRFLFLTIEELYSNTLYRTEVSYDLTLEVLDRSGCTLAQTHAQAKEKDLGMGVGGSYFYAPGALPKEVGSALTSMTQSSNIRNALK